MVLFVRSFHCRTTNGEFVGAEFAALLVQNNSSKNPPTDVEYPYTCTDVDFASNAGLRRFIGVAFPTIATGCLMDRVLPTRLSHRHCRAGAVFCPLTNEMKRHEMKLDRLALIYYEGRA